MKLSPGDLLPGSRDLHVGLLLISQPRSGVLVASAGSSVAVQLARRFNTASTRTCR